MEHKRVSNEVKIRDNFWNNLFFLFSYFYLFPIPYPLARISFRKGQTTIEYLLMLASIVAAALLLAMLFYRKLLGAIFTIIGMIIGAGVPQK